MRTIIECENCNEILGNPNEPCPKCKSDKKRILYSVMNFMNPDDQISISIEATHRIWPYLPKSIQHTFKILKEKLPHQIEKGFCLQIILSTAAFVEGIVTDHIEEELRFLLPDPTKGGQAKDFLEGLEFNNWEKKNRKIVPFLKWEIPQLENYALVDVLFNIRNNLGHGKSYKVVDKRTFNKKAWVREQPEDIENINYTKVYKALVEKGILPEMDLNSTFLIEPFLSPSIADFFYSGALIFLYDFHKQIKLSNHLDMLPEFENSIK
jgi:hypothetical protein